MLPPVDGTMMSPPDPDELELPPAPLPPFSSVLEPQAAATGTTTEPRAIANESEILDCIEYFLRLASSAKHPRQR
jgi:hypothetical protein